MAIPVRMAASRRAAAAAVVAVPGLEPGERVGVRKLVWVWVVLGRVERREVPVVVLVRCRCRDWGKLRSLALRGGASAKRRISERTAFVGELIGTRTRMCAFKEATFVAELCHALD